MHAADLAQFVKNILTILNIINNVLVFSTYREHIVVKEMTLNEKVKGIIKNDLISLRKVF